MAGWIHNYSRANNGFKIIWKYLFPTQRPKLAVPRRSSVQHHICVSPSVGSVTEIKTVPTGLTRVSKLAVVRITPTKKNIKLVCTFCGHFAGFTHQKCLSQCSTTRAAAKSSCARTDSVSPNTLCVTMTTTAATAQTSPRSAVSGAMASYS